MKTKEFLALFRKNLLSYVLVLLILLLVVMFRKPLIVLGLIIIGGLSTIYKRVANISIGFEAITFFSIVLTYAYNVWVGIISAVLMTLISHITTGRICATMFGKMAVYAIVLVIAALLSSANIVWVGVGLSIATYVLFFVMYVFVFGYNPVSSITSAIGGIFFNYIFFSRFGEVLLKLLI